MIPVGTIFQLGDNFRPKYLHKAVVEVTGPLKGDCYPVEILRLEKPRKGGSFYVGGKARIPTGLIPSKAWTQGAAAA